MEIISNSQVLQPCVLDSAGQSENQVLQFCAEDVAKKQGPENQQIEKSLHLKFIKFGNDRRRLTNELLAILPEIYSRGIYKKYAATIIEYAGKFGGLSKGVVLKRLRLEKYLENKPLLREAVRTEGVHKVALVAALATPETEKTWLDKVENMSKAALQELSKEVRGQREGMGANLRDGSAESGAVENGFGIGSSAFLCKAVSVKITLELDEEMSFSFLSLKKKLGKNLGNKEVMKKILEMAMTGVAGNGRAIGSGVGRKTVKKVKDGVAEISKPVKVGHSRLDSASVLRLIPGDNLATQEVLCENIVTRYISASLKRSSLAATNNRCSYPNCNRPPEVFHHTERFALNQSHKSIRPLCGIHHEFTHNGLILNENLASENWQLKMTDGSLNWADLIYRKQRKMVNGLDVG